MEETPISNPSTPELESEPNPERKNNSRAYSIIRLVQTVISVGVVMATLLTLWNPHGLFKNPSMVSFLPTPINPDQNGSGLPASVHVGIQIGHYKHDEGNTCPDGIKEVDVDYVIASKVQALLATTGVNVDMLDEYDLKLLNYKSDVLVSIHTGSCTDASAAVSGFKIANQLRNESLDNTNNLAACLGDAYHQNTGLAFGYEIITDDNPLSHTFIDINPQTPAVLIETGSLAVDREIIINNSDRAANGITAGILCYLKNEKLIK